MSRLKYMFAAPLLLCLAASASAQEAAPPPETVISAAEATAQIGGLSTVSLHFRDATPEQVFTELFRQAGIPWGNGDSYWKSQGWPPLTVDMDHVPVWSAVSQLCQQLGVEPVQFHQINGHALEQLFDKGPAQMAGPFLIVEPDWMRFPGSPLPTSAGYARSFTLFMDPKLHRGAGQATVESVEALDKAGHLLASSAAFPVNTQVYPSDNLTWRWDLTTELRPPEGETKSEQAIQTYRAVICLPVVTKTLRWTIPNVLTARDVYKTQGDESYRMESITTRDGGFDVRLRTSRVGDNQDHLEPDPTTFVRLLDSSGHDLRQEPHGYERPGRGRDSYLIHFSAETRKSPLDSTGPPATLVWELPTESCQVKILFAFQSPTAP